MVGAVVISCGMWNGERTGSAYQQGDADGDVVRCGLVLEFGSVYAHELARTEMRQPGGSQTVQSRGYDRRVETVCNAQGRLNGHTITVLDGGQVGLRLRWHCLTTAAYRLDSAMLQRSMGIRSFLSRCSH